MSNYKTRKAMKAKLFFASLILAMAFLLSACNSIMGPDNYKVEIEDSYRMQVVVTFAYLTEDESINNIGASIAYAFNKNTENWTSVTLSTWVCDVIFAPCYLEKAQKLSYKEKKGFNAKETDTRVQEIYVMYKEI